MTPEAFPEAFMGMLEANGGPAHPCEYASGDGGTVFTGGLTIRDHFAGQALIATYLNGFAGPDNERRAQICYALADAMLAERQKP